MTEQVRENYFLAVRIIVVLAIEIYIAVTNADLAGTSGGVLLLLALFLGAVVGREMLTFKWQWTFLLAAGCIWGILLYSSGMEYFLLGILLVYEVISYVAGNVFSWYLLPVLLALVPTEIPILVQLLISILLGIVYFQHNMVVNSYRKTMKEDSITEANLKKDIHQQETMWKQELKRGLLGAENQMLEEKGRLAQALHDKLGHSINGSIYQLEAVKVLMDKDTEKSQTMVQAVIDNLRTGMDEIRLILRKERPEKYKLALVQLQQLCDKCSQMGVETELEVEGELSHVPENYLEIILDNAFEAISNSLKYAKCTRITIKIHVMNQMIRCSVADNGIGCNEITDGMGLAGMRKRVRDVNGILDFETDMGFAVNMLLPMK